MLSLLRLIPYTGSISIDGIDISKVPRHTLRSRIITIAQDHAELVNASVQLNLCPWTMDMSKTDAASHLIQAEQLLTKFSLWSIIDEEGGWNAKMSALCLSQGQKQLFGIARSLLQQLTMKSKVLLVDEATSHLDDDTEQLVYETIQEYFTGCTIITVSHRPAMLEHGDVTLRMSEGSIAKTIDHRKGEKIDMEDDAADVEENPDDMLFLPSTVYQYKPESRGQAIKQGESSDTADGHSASSE